MTEGETTPEQFQLVQRILSVMLLHLASHRGMTQGEMEGYLQRAVQTVLDADAGDEEAVAVNNNGVRHLSALLGTAATILAGRSDRLQ